ncbi:hypothetical protein [Pseudoduganella violaceinigra]|uniref:hypothetical protein n=1 Tax=Pseudoduganella violaceinigra TaxID=246602 RepID=UPI00040AA768|nr:hypothetical protein [Pseudoduganella violaceinigra]
MFATQCLAANPEVHDALTADEAASCEFSAQTMHWLATYRDQRATQERAVERYMTEARSAKVADLEMEKGMRAAVMRRAAFVYAMASFSPVTFDHFEFSVCKMGMLKHWHPDFGKAELITQEVESCQAQFKDGSSTEFAACVDKVVFKFHR